MITIRVLQIWISAVKYLWVCISHEITGLRSKENIILHFNVLTHYMELGLSHALHM